MVHGRLPGTLLVSRALDETDEHSTEVRSNTHSRAGEEGDRQDVSDRHHEDRRDDELHLQGLRDVNDKAQWTERIWDGMG